MNKLAIGKIVGAVIIVFVAVIAIGLWSSREGRDEEVGITDYRNATYMIGDENVTLKDGFAETESAPGSASKTITRYFGNDFKTDLNADGREDVIFILTQEGGGSGTFFYVVGAVNTTNGYVGTDGYPLGDRIAPQGMGVSPYPHHKNVIVVNYADRAPGEPMTAEPSVGHSVYLKLDQENMRWGFVLPDFEGESY